MQHKIVTYPEPPPTCNVLTSNQRQKLLKTTQKLGKVLGTSPQLVDCNYTVHIDFPPKRRNFSHSSIDSCPPLSPASSTSTSSTLSVYAASANESVASYAASAIEPQGHYTKQNRPRKPPQLRLAVNTPSNSPFGNSMRASLDTIPGSPPPSTFSAHSTESSSPLYSPYSPADHLVINTSPTTRSYTISVPRTRRPSSLVTQNEPQFRVPSEASARRQKMERIRKRLGECVPVEAVFPEEHEEDTDEETFEEDDEDWIEAVKADHRSNFAAQFTTLEAVFECPDEHGEEGLTPVFRHASLPSTKAAPKSWSSRVLCRLRK